MVFNARVINLRVYNAGHNVLRQQAALHFGPPVGKPEEEAVPPPPKEQQRGRGRGGGRKFFVLWRLFSGA